MKTFVDVLGIHTTQHILHQLIPGESIRDMSWHALIQTQNLALLRYASSVRSMRRPAYWTTHYFSHANDTVEVSTDYTEYLLQHTIPATGSSNEVLLAIPTVGDKWLPSPRTQRIAELLLKYRHIWPPDKQYALIRSALHMHGTEEFAMKVLRAVPNPPAEILSMYAETSEFIRLLVKTYEKAIWRLDFVAILKRAISQNDIVVINSIQRADQTTTLERICRMYSGGVKWAAREILSQPLTKTRIAVIDNMIRAMNTQTIQVISSALIISSHVPWQELGMTHRHDYRHHKSADLEVIDVAIKLGPRAQISFEALAKMTKSNEFIKPHLAKKTPTTPEQREMRDRMNEIVLGVHCCIMS